MKIKKSVIIEKTDGKIKDAIASHIKSLRRQKDLSAAAVAKKLGISRVSLTQIENGKTNITAVTLWKLACILETDIQKFFPKPPEGFGLGKIELQSIEKESKEAVEWATQLFGTTNQK